MTASPHINRLSAALPRGRASSLVVSALDADRFIPQDVELVRYVISWRGRPYNVIHLGIAQISQNFTFSLSLPEAASNPPASDLSVECFWIIAPQNEQLFAVISVSLQDSAAASYLSAVASHVFSSIGRAVAGQLGSPFIAPANFTLAALALYCQHAPGQHGLECTLQSSDQSFNPITITLAPGQRWNARESDQLVAANSTISASIVSTGADPDFGYHPSLTIYLIKQ